MGTYLKIAPQNTNVSFTSVDAGVNVTADTANFTTASFGDVIVVTGSGYFEGNFSGSFTGSFLFSAPLYVPTSNGSYLLYDTGSDFTLFTTGSIPTSSYFLLIKNNNTTLMKVTHEGSLQLKTFTGSAPTPISGGIYFSPYDMYIGTEDNMLAP
jgi:hypothetical protein